MRVAALGLDPGGRPLLLLREVGGEQRILPVWIGAPEAEAIAVEQQRVRPPRPPTHHLIAQVIAACGRRLRQVDVTALRENVYHAELVYDDDTRVSARVSDAVALALHVGVTIQAADSVLEHAGIPDAEITHAEADRSDLSEADVERFRRFLDHASPEDFGPN